MLKFIKHHMDSIDGIGLFPTISFVIFGVFFAVMIVYVIRMTREEITEIEHYPLDEH